MRSLGHEIYSTGKGGGYSWLQEHLGDDYIAAWYVPEIKDAAIVNSGMSRWHNYYVEGMNWLVQNVGIDGIYLDDVAFDRITMKRIKRVLHKTDTRVLSICIRQTNITKAMALITALTCIWSTSPTLTVYGLVSILTMRKNSMQTFS
jgi:hypothetical protein